MIGCISSYFRLLTIGHIRLIRHASQLCEKLYAIVNNDEQLKLKGVFSPYSESERLEIVQGLSGVYKAVLSIDTDSTVCETLKLIKPNYFFNGGDVTSFKECRESSVCEDLGIKMFFNVGGGKVSSSTELEKRIIDNYNGKIRRC